LPTLKERRQATVEDANTEDGEYSDQELVDAAGDHGPPDGSPYMSVDGDEGGSADVEAEDGLQPEMEGGWREDAAPLEEPPAIEDEAKPAEDLDTHLDMSAQYVDDAGWAESEPELELDDARPDDAKVTELVRQSLLSISQTRARRRRDASYYQDRAGQLAYDSGHSPCSVTVMEACYQVGSMVLDGNMTDTLADQWCSSMACRALSRDRARS
jgi:hypothetical protein